MNLPTFPKRLLRCLLTLAVVLNGLALSACGGSDESDIVPTGEPIADHAFVDSDSYHPLDKLRPNGKYYNESDADYGPRNPAHVAGDATTSVWAIDASASTPEKNEIAYSMRVEAINASEFARDSMARNLRIHTGTGLISQSCQGFPECYDNVTATDQTFRITVVAKVKGSSGALTRSFQVRVTHNN